MKNIEHDIIIKLDVGDPSWACWNQKQSRKKLSKRTEKLPTKN